MIGISSKKNKYTYNAYHIVKSFFPGEEIIQKVEEKQEPLMAVRLPGGSCFSLAPEEVDAVLEGQKFFSEEEREQAVKKEVTRRLEEGSDQAAVPVSDRRDGEDARVGYADRSAPYEDSHGAAGGRSFGRRGGTFYDEEILCESGESFPCGRGCLTGECTPVQTGL